MPPTVGRLLTAKNSVSMTGYFFKRLENVIVRCTNERPRKSVRSLHENIHWMLLRSTDFPRKLNGKYKFSGPKPSPVSLVHSPKREFRCPHKRRVVYYVQVLATLQDGLFFELSHTCIRNGALRFLEAGEHGFCDHLNHPLETLHPRLTPRPVRSALSKDNF